MRMIIAALGFLLFQQAGLGQITVKGTIQNNVDERLPSATIDLYGPRQTLSSAAADAKGAFEITSLSPGEKYLLEITAAGYGTEVIALQLYRDTSLSVRLAPKATALENITVSSRAKLLEIRSDRTIVNISAHPIIAGSSVAEALNKIPGIQAHNDQVLIPGKGSVQLMMNGRLLQLSQKELITYLRAIPASSVSKLEIITNPSAAYDAAGNAGLINIVTKRSAEKGFSGNLQAAYKHWQEDPGYDLSGNIHYNTGKWSLYANGNLFRMHRAFGFRWETYYPDRSWIMSDTGDYRLSNATITAGADYKISERSAIGVNAGYTRYIEDGADYVRNHFYNGAGVTDSLLTAYADYLPIAKSQSYGMHYKTQFDTLGSKLTVDGSYFNFYRTDRSNFTGRTFLPGGQPVESSTSRYYYTALQNINIYALKADVELPVKDVNLQFGGKINFIDIYSNTFYHRVTGQERIYDPELSIEYNYRENTQALYLNAGKDISKWTLQAGLRGELTQTKGFAYLTNETNRNNYLKLFPNLLAAYKPDGRSNFSFSYNKRINRPTFWNLNPFKSLLTAYSYYEGNPFLQPEYISNIQAQHIYKNKLTGSLYGSILNNGFTDITIAETDTVFVLRTPKNFVNSIRLGISESYLFNTLPWWESNNLFTVYYTDGRSTLNYVRDRKGWGAYFSTSNTFYLNTSKTVSAAVNFWYQFPEVQLVNKTDAYYNIDLGVSAALLKGKIGINAALQDVFGSSAPSYTNYVNNIRQKYATLQLNRNFALTLIYKFGKKEAKETDHIQSNQEERERL